MEECSPFFSVDVVVIIAAWCLMLFFPCRMPSSVFSVVLLEFCVHLSLSYSNELVILTHFYDANLDNISTTKSSTKQRIMGTKWRDEDDENEGKRHWKTLNFFSSLLFDAHNSQHLWFSIIDPLTSTKRTLQNCSSMKFTHILFALRPTKLKI